jgi:hypothetical protein
MKTITVTKVRTRNTIAIVLFLASLIIVMSMLSSCSGCSQSGKRVSMPLEKVIIIDGKTTTFDRDVTITHYKVKRINAGVMTYISVPGTLLYEKGDTILWKFLN